MCPPSKRASTSCSAQTSSELPGMNLPKIMLASALLFCGVWGAAVQAAPNLPSPAASEARASITQPFSAPDFDDPAALEDARRGGSEAIGSLVDRLPKPYREQEIHPGGIRCLEFTTEHTLSNKVMLYLHGGGYFSGDPELARPMTAALATESPLRVVSVDYRLAPEHPFPAALDDALAVYDGLIESGLSADDIIVAGTSAGGGLTLSLALSLRAEGRPLPRALILISPWADLTGKAFSHRALEGIAPVMTWDGTLEAGAALYAGETPRDHPHVSPIFADFEGLPPTLVLVGGAELLVSDALNVTRAARAAGVPVTLDVRDAMWHLFPFWPDPNMPEAVSARRTIVDFARGQLGLE